MRATKPTEEQIKAAADRAQARSDGTAPEEAAAGLNDKRTADQHEADARAATRGFRFPEENSRGIPYKGSMMNVVKAIEVLGLTCRYDEFLGDYNISGPGLGSFIGKLDDKIVRKFRDLCFEETSYEPGKDAASEGFLRTCEENKYNSIIDYLTPLRWDRVKRLDTWLTVYLGACETPLHRAWGRMILIAACRRVFEPGCKFDHVLVLEGLEGIGKSTAVKVLACGVAASERPKYFSDSTILDKDERAQMELTKGVWFYELSEMSGATRADQKKLKAFVVRQEERARGAYERFKENQPRIPIMVGSINPDPNTGAIPEYLNPGDRRRWWPLPVGICDELGNEVAGGVEINIDGLIRDRDQLFAEAMDSSFDELGERLPWEPLNLNRSHWEAAEAVQIDREISDPLVDRLSTLYSRLSRPMKTGAQRAIDGKLATQGEDYGFRSGEFYGRADDEVWVTSKFVVEMLPPAMTSDGRRLPLAMGKLGWTKVRDTRSGSKATCYVHRIEDKD
jgi:hypothetical protein